MIDPIISALKGYLELNDSKKVDSNLTDAISVESFGGSKRVNKPWGFELWLSDATEAPYAFKIIYLKAGTKTSLQFHKEKIEHNCIISGLAKFYYENPKNGEIVNVELEAGQVVRILPPGVHRFEALTDLLLIEASTAHLEDVVRLEDDYKRPDGKIENEHERKKEKSRG